VPVIRAEADGPDQYLFGAVFPRQALHSPVPEELLAQVRGRTNLIYYDWELTAERVIHGKQFYQLANIIDSRHPVATNAVSARWLDAVGPKLGNSITEITQTSPQELSLVRKSHLGFTGFELATFSAWLDSPGFPLTFERPPRNRSRTNATPARVNVRSGGTNASGAAAVSPARTNPPPGGKR